MIYRRYSSYREALLKHDFEVALPFVISNWRSLYD